MCPSAERAALDAPLNRTQGYYCEIIKNAYSLDIVLTRLNTLHEKEDRESISNQKEIDKNQVDLN